MEHRDLTEHGGNILAGYLNKPAPPAIIAKYGPEWRKMVMGIERTEYGDARNRRNNDFYREVVLQKLEGCAQ